MFRCDVVMYFLVVFIRDVRIQNLSKTPTSVRHFKSYFELTLEKSLQ
jgi:hypothetical protein